MTNPVPVYVQQKGGNYRYGTQVIGDPGWIEPHVAFYAYPSEQEGTTAFYRHRAGGSDRFEYDDRSEAHDGWEAGEDKIYVYPPTQPKSGSVPIYLHTADQRFYYDTNIVNKHGWSSGTLVFFALPSLDGYRVGDKTAEISGPDQSNKTAKLTELLHGNKNWVLIDVSAVWCPSCNYAASKIHAFLASVNSAKLTLKPFTVLCDDRNGKASTQATAEQWASKYNFDAKEPIVHCAGDPKSPLRSLLYNYAMANPNLQPAYPTFVLVDEDGIVRHFQQGNDLDELQRALSNASGVTLTGGPWMT